MRKKTKTSRLSWQIIAPILVHVFLHPSIDFKGDFSRLSFVSYAAKIGGVLGDKMLSIIQSYGKAYRLLFMNLMQKDHRTAAAPNLHGIQ